MNLKCTHKKLEMNLKWAHKKLEMNLKWTHNELEMYLKWTEYNQNKLEYNQIIFRIYLK